MTNPHEPDLGGLLQACVNAGFWTRVGIYSGLAISMLIAAQQQFLMVKYRLTDQHQADAGERVMQQALQAVQQVHAQAGKLPMSLDALNASLVVWTTSTSEAGGVGPQQTVNGQMFPPRQDRGIVLTYANQQQHFIGVAFVGTATRLRTLVCRGDRPFEPTEFSVNDLRQGRQSLTCPPGGTPLPLP